MLTPNLRLHSVLVTVISLVTTPTGLAQNASSTSSSAVVITLGQIIVDAKQPTDWNDPQWNVHDVPNPACNGGYRRFEHDISLQELAGHAVKTIHVTAFRPPPVASSKGRKNVRQRVLEVWQGKLQTAFCQVAWAEITNWSINAMVEFDDGKRGSLLTDGSHVRLLDHDGKFWFLRLLPAAQ